MKKKKTETTDEARAVLDAQLEEAKRDAFFVAFQIIKPAASSSDDNSFDVEIKAVIEAFRAVESAGDAYRKSVRSVEDHYPHWGSDEIVAQACAIAHEEFDPEEDVCPNGALGTPLLVFAAAARFLRAIEEAGSATDGGSGVCYYDPMRLVDKYLGRKKSAPIFRG